MPTRARVEGTELGLEAIGRSNEVSESTSVGFDNTDVLLPLYRISRIHTLVIQGDQLVVDDGLLHAKEIGDVTASIGLSLPNNTKVIGDLLKGVSHGLVRLHDRLQVTKHAVEGDDVETGVASRKGREGRRRRRPLEKRRVPEDRGRLTWTTRTSGSGTLESVSGTFDPNNVNSAHLNKEGQLTHERQTEESAGQQKDPQQQKPSRKQP
jgi:hypothetical protein